MPTIRRATIADIKSVAALVEEQLFKGVGVEQRVRRMIECSPETCFVAIDQHCVGVLLSMFNGFHVVLSHMAVHEAHQGRGVGRALHDALVECAESLGAIGVITDSWLGATGFYVKLGYRLPGAVFLIRDLKSRAL
jgi:GNAT superfamily N-acetyltransferase